MTASNVEVTVPSGLSVRVTEDRLTAELADGAPSPFR